jgi:hypothetical protein
MVDPGDGQRLMCMWDDCQLAGDTQHQAVVTEPHGVDPALILIPAPNMDQPWQRVIFLFCSQRHLMYWTNSHISLYNLPTGSRGTLL